MIFLIKKYWLYLFTIITIILVGLSFLFDVAITTKTKTLRPLAPVMTTFVPALYPSLTTPLQPNISADAAIVVDTASQVVLYSKNPELLFSPASTTKIMTALVALDTFHLSDVLTVKTPILQPVTMGFKKGQRITFENVLYAMLLPSANDAPQAIADNYPGGAGAFVVAMNKRAHELHLLHTHFGDAIGLDDDNDYTTALDLSRLASITMQNTTFAKIVGTKYYTVATLDGSLFPVKNLNELLGLYGVNGVKTGYTEEAGQVLVTSVVRDDHDYIVVVMGSDDRFADTLALLPILSNITYQSMHP